MTRSERLLALLAALRGKHQPVTAKALADRFGVSERTIYRDIVTLNRDSAVIDGEAGLGYVLRDEILLPPLAFGVQEAAALLLGLRFVQRRGDPALAEAANSARGKLAAVLPGRFDDRAAMAIPLLVPPPANPRMETLGIVRDALLRERKLRLDYVDAADRPSERVVWPVALGWFDGMEMLSAWCEARDAFRHFRLDRIRSAQALDAPLPRPHRALLADFRRLEPGIAL